MYRFVNAYAPHSGLTINRVTGPCLLDKFYSLALQSRVKHNDCFLTYNTEMALEVIISAVSYFVTIF